MRYLAVDLGGTKLATAVLDDTGALTDREVVPIGGRAGEDVAALIAERLLAERERVAHRIDAVGVTVPGIYRADRGTVWAPNIPGWDDFPLRETLAQALGDGTPVTVDSDRAAYIMGETWRGAARGARDAVFVAVGTGIGAGILVDGRVLRGHADIAGAIGWLALDRPFRDAYVSCGCFEHHASGPGLAKVARALLVEQRDYDGELRTLAPEALTAEVLFAAAARDDVLATRVIDDAIAYWGMAAANLVSLFNPEVIVFGGGVFGPAARLIGRIRDEALRWAQPIAVRQTAFVASTLAGDAGLYGAARLAMLAAARAPEAVA
jgi:glucokinase